MYVLRRVYMEVGRKWIIPDGYVGEEAGQEGKRHTSLTRVRSLQYIERAPVIDCSCLEAIIRSYCPLLDNIPISGRILRNYPANSLRITDQHFHHR